MPVTFPVRRHRSTPAGIRGVPRWMLSLTGATLAVALGAVAGGVLMPSAPAAAVPTKKPTPMPTAPSGKNPTPKAPAGAIEWSVTPVNGAGGDARSALNYTIPPDTIITDAVTVANRGDTPLTLSVYATDAFTTPDGSFALLTAQQQPVDLGSWIRFDTTTVTVPAHASLRVPFQLRVPANASPGDHAAGIVASRQVPGATSGDAQVTVDQRVGTRVFARVNGPLHPNLSVSDLTVHYGGSAYPVSRNAATVSFTVHNGGNIRLASTARVSLLAPFGVTLADSTPIDIPMLLPNETYTGTVTIHGGFPAVRLTARMDLDAINPPGMVPVDLPHQRNEATIWAVPWLLLAAIAVIVLALWPGRLLLRRARHGRATATASACDEDNTTPVNGNTAPAGDDGAKTGDAPVVG